MSDVRVPKPKSGRGTLPTLTAPIPAPEVPEAPAVEDKAPTIPLRATTNMTQVRGRRTKDMNFKVDDDFHLEFKMSATKRRMSMNDLLYACFRNFEELFPPPK